jgi:hypothetical protein
MHEGIRKDFLPVLGEVPQPRTCLKFTQPALHPGGLLSITEMQGNPVALGLVEVQRFARLCEFSSFETVSLFNRKSSLILPLEGCFASRQSYPAMENIRRHGGHSEKAVKTE